MEFAEARGWIYVLTNPVMPGLVKIGKSGRDPVERAQQLAGTGHPDAFELQFDVLVTSYHELEIAVHNELAEARYKGSGKGSEFFTCELLMAIETVRRVCAPRILIEHVSRSLASQFEKAKHADVESSELHRLCEEINRLRGDESKRSAAQNGLFGEKLPFQAAICGSRTAWMVGQRERVERIPTSRDLKEMMFNEIRQNRMALCVFCDHIHSFNTSYFGYIECRNCHKSFLMPPL